MFDFDLFTAPTVYAGATIVVKPAIPVLGSEPTVRTFLSCPPVIALCSVCSGICLSEVLSVNFLARLAVWPLSVLGSTPSRKDVQILDFAAFTALFLSHPMLLCRVCLHLTRSTYDSQVLHLNSVLYSICMTKGRKPRAIAVNEAGGSYSKNPSRRPTNIVKADPRDPDPPAFLTADPVAMEHWHEVVDVLRSAQILSKTDTHLLATYCSVYSEWTKCHDHIQKNGHADENGKTSPESVAYFKLLAQHGKLVAELGLSPSSRARLSAVTSEEEKEDEVSITSLLKSMKKGN